MSYFSRILASNHYIVILQVLHTAMLRWRLQSFAACCNGAAAAGSRSSSLGNDAKKSWPGQAKQQQDAH